MRLFPARSPIGVDRNAISLTARRSCWPSERFTDRAVCSLGQNVHLTWPSAARVYWPISADQESARSQAGRLEHDQPIHLSLVQIRSCAGLDELSFVQTSH